MTADALQPGRFEGAILLADISGYTSFLESVRIAHATDAFADGRIPSAYGLMSGLLEGIATRVDPPFTLVKFEGDAVFAVALEDAVPHGRAMLDCVADCYRDFVHRLDEAGVTWSCTCAACSRKDALDLKFVVHFGECFVQPIGPNMDVLGPDITLAHRLLKNSAPDLIGSGAYALFTEAATEVLALPLDAAASQTEHVEGMDPVGTRVVPLSR